MLIPIIILVVYLLIGYGLNFFVTRYIGTSRGDEPYAEQVWAILLWPTYLILLALCYVAYLATEQPDEREKRRKKKK